MMNNININNNRILLVDDEPDITLTFRLVLEDNGFVVNAFNDSPLALSSFKQGLYALALIDIKMPKINGFDLYKEIRKLDNRIKVCFMTAFDIKRDELNAELPALKEENPVIFRKPIKIEDLVSGINAELEG